jgi:hypothetical protein
VADHCGSDTVGIRGLGGLDGTMESMAVLYTRPRRTTDRTALVSESSRQTRYR